MSTQPNENDTVALTYGETGYGPGDGFVYFIRSPSGRSTIRRLGLTHMSDAWKEHMLAHYESKRPAYEPARRPMKVPVHRGPGRSGFRPGGGF